MLLSLLAACVNDTGIQPDTSLPQQSEPTPSPTGLPGAYSTILPQQSQPMSSPTRWPVAYSTILEEYKTLADYLYRGIYDIVDDEEWQDQNIPILSGEEGIFWEPGNQSMPFLGDKDAYGYALKDLNGDGSDELILLLKDYTALAVYSTADGKPKLVDRYCDVHDCYAIDESGLFYIYGFDGADDWSYGIYQLSHKGSKLYLKEEYGKSTDNLKRVEDPYYYKVIDGKSKREIISKTEFEEFYKKYPAFNDSEKAAEITKSAVVFIPILD